MAAKRKLRLWACVAVCALAVSTAAGNSLITTVPDWNQPNNYGPPPPAGGYPNWCSPTAGGNIMGYWENVQGKTGLADGAVGAVAYAGNVGTWMQGLFNDGQVEMGWFMDTANWMTNGGPFPPNAGGTNLNKIGPGMLGYSVTPWNDPFGPVKSAYAATISKDVAGGIPLAGMWANYMNEINANRPVAVTFDRWVLLNPTGQTWQVNGQNVVEHFFDPQLTMAHTVAGVGWIDPTPLLLASGDEYFITQDGWPGTPQFVAVALLPPGGSQWIQNDYITIGQNIDDVIPEPASAVLVLLALPAVAARLRRRVRTRV